jgi:hypothetical protein
MNHNHDASAINRMLIEADELDTGPDEIYPLNGHATQQPPVAPPETFQTISAAELDAATFKTEFLIDGLLVAGQPLVVAGSKKSLKTSLLCDAVISLAGGLPFLNQVDVLRACRTLFVSAESGMATLQETCRRIAWAKHRELAQISGLYFSDIAPRIEDARELVKLGHTLEEREIEVVALDPAYLMMGGEDAGNLFKQGLALRALNDVCRERGVTLALCHHNKRNVSDQFGVPQLEDIAWAGFQEWARQWWLLGRRKPYEPGSGLHELWFHVGGSAGHSELLALDIDEGTLKTPGGRFWNVGLQSAQEAAEQAAAAKQAAGVAKHAAKLATAMKDYPAGETAKVLRDAAGLNSTNFQPAIQALIKAGKATTCEVQKAKGSFDGYKLT